MISKPEFNFLFVAVSKTASCSVRNSITRAKLGRQLNRNALHPELVWSHPQHYNIRDYKVILEEEDFNNRFKFAFVRNPWDRLVSNYTATCKSGGDNGYTLTPSDRQCPEKFQEWAKAALGTEYWEVDCYRRPQCRHHRTTYDSLLSWLTDEDGHLLVDFIGRFETLEVDYNLALDKIEQRCGKLITRIPFPRKGVSTIGHHYSFYYNDELIEKVRDHFKEDIDYFGYEYETRPV
jgi:hypothetical protein